VLVGDASVFSKDLKGVGFDEFERIPLGLLDLDAPDLRRKAAPAPAPRGAGYVPATYIVPQVRAEDPARALIDHAVRAKGGLAALRGVKTVKATAETVFATPQGAKRVATTTYVRYPGQFRVDATGPDGLVVQTFDNGAAWMRHEGEVKDMPPQIAAALQASVQRDTLALLLALHDSKVTARRVADTTLAGAACPTLEVDLVPAGRLTLVFDPSTHLLVSQRYGGTPGNPTTVESFLDYRNVQGLQVPYRIRVRVEGQPPIERVNQAVDFNVTVDPTLFVKPRSS
jgi:hypothetical protein